MTQLYTSFSTINKHRLSDKQKQKLQRIREQTPAQQIQENKNNKPRQTDQLAVGAHHQMLILGGRRRPDQRAPGQEAHPGLPGRPRARHQAQELDGQRGRGLHAERDLDVQKHSVIVGQVAAGIGTRALGDRPQPTPIRHPAPAAQWSEHIQSAAPAEHVAATPAP